MRGRRTIAVIAGIVLVAGAVYSASALASSEGQRGFVRGHKGPGLRGMIMGRVARELNLTDQQKVEIKAIIEAERPRVEPLVRQLAATRRELREATANGQFDEAQVGALASRQGQTLAQLIVEKERVKSQVYGVLTPEQRAKAAEIINRIESRIRQRAAEHGFEF